MLATVEHMIGTPLSPTGQGSVHQGDAGRAVWRVSAPRLLGFRDLVHFILAASSNGK